jgi:alpha-L-rhamnosidase
VAAWADAGTICPTTIYQVYNDRRLLEKHYAAMVRWVEYCRKHSKNLLRPAAGYGDWLSINAETPKDVLATALFRAQRGLDGRRRRALGKADDARKYDESLSANQGSVQHGLRRARRANQGRHADRLRAGLVVRLVVRRKNATAAVRRLVDDIQSRGTHLSTGFVGTSQC